MREDRDRREAQESTTPGRPREKPEETGVISGCKKLEDALKLFSSTRFTGFISIRMRFTCGGIQTISVEETRKIAV